MCKFPKGSLDEQKGEVTREIKAELAAGLIKATAFVAPPNIMIRLQSDEEESVGFARWSSEDRAATEFLTDLLEELAEVPASDSLAVELHRGVVGLKILNELEKVEWDESRGKALAAERAIHMLRDVRLGLTEVEESTQKMRIPS